MPFPSLTRCALGLAAVVLAVGFFARSAHAGAVISRPLYLGLDQGLVGYWSFEGKTISGTRVFDASGNGNYGTMTNGPQVVEGKLGQGMSFDGSNDYVDIPPTPAFVDNTAGSVSLWFLTKSFTAEQTLADVIFVSDPDEFRIEYLGDSNDQLRVVVVNNGTASAALDTANNTITDSNWHHLVVTSDGSVLRLFLDGAQKTLTAAVGSNTGQWFASAVDANRLNLGSLNTGSPLLGTLDDVRIYNRALSGDEIKRLYKIGATAKLGVAAANDSLANGLVGWWNFDGKTISGTRVLDASGTGNYGTMTNGPTLVNGKLGQGMSFDGSDDYVDIASQNGFSAGSGATWTLTAWAKTDVLNSNHHFIVGYGDGTSGTSPHIQLDNLNHWQTSTYGNDLSGPPAVKGQWTHVVGVGSGTTLRLYIDGQQYASTVVTNAPVTTRARIGTDMSASPALNFDGLIDDVRIYNRALSAGEVKRLYNLGGTVKLNTTSTSLQNGLVGWWTFDGKDISAIDGVTSRQIYDRSGGGNVGKYLNATTTLPVIGKIGQALEFDGSDDYVDAGDINAIDGAGALTITGWAKQNMLDVQAGIFAKGDSVAQGYVSLETYDDGNLYFEIGPGGSVTDGHFDYSTVVSPNTWFHVAAVFNGSASDNPGRVKIYINGVQQALSFNGTIPATLANSGTKPATIGLFSVEGPDKPWNGLLDDMRVYNRALSADEIKRLYNMGR